MKNEDSVYSHLDFEGFKRRVRYGWLRVWETMNSYNALMTIQQFMTEQFVDVQQHKIKLNEKSSPLNRNSRSTVSGSHHCICNKFVCNNQPNKMKMKQTKKEEEEEETI